MFLVGVFGMFCFLGGNLGFWFDVLWASWVFWGPCEDGEAAQKSYNRHEN